MSGSVTLSCGHESQDYPNDCIYVSYGDWTCDAIEGFSPTVVTAAFCPTCAHELYESGDWLMTDEQEDAWLDREATTTPQRKEKE